MFSIIVVSHSKKLAEGVAEVAKMMARDVTIVAAGGTDDGTLGTSYEKIAAAIEDAYTNDGVALLSVKYFSVGGCKKVKRPVPYSVC